MRVKRLAVITVLGALLAAASDAPAGGIADVPCPDVRGENTNTCPPGTVGTPYSIRFAEREGSGCGPGQQTFHLDSGLLPPGLTLTPDGTLSGTSTQAGRFQFYVEMREPENDPANCAAKRTQKQFTLVVRRQPWIVSKPAAPPPAEVGEPFGMTLRARGGSGVFAWSLVSGRLPAGVRLSSDGSLAGSPRRAGVHRFELRARDTEARSVRWEATLSVAQRLRIRAQRLPAAKVGRAYGADLSVSGGVAPIMWTLERSRLPLGIGLARASGRLSGVPRKPGTQLVTVRVSDALGVEHTRTFSFVVRESRPAAGRSA